MNFIKILLFFIVTLVAFGERVEVVSESMEAINIKKEVQFMGDVKVTQLQDWLHADKVIVYFDDNNETREYKAIGKVTFEFKNEVHNYIGSADTVIYYPQKSIYVLIGNAIVDDVVNKRHIDGNKITLNMISGDADVKGTKKKPVKFIFDMESNDKDNKK
ncbi:MAG: lipopolysaccharide transport periplasmic protein LptA [Sulfurovum sp.]